MLSLYGIRHIAKTRIGSIGLFLSIILFDYGCSERIDIKLDTTDKRVVIYGTINTDTVAHRISLTESADYYNGDSPTPISGAEVYLNDGNQTIVLTESPDNPGNYYTPPDYFAKSGTTYTLTVENVRIENSTSPQSFTATGTMPVLPEGYQHSYIDSIKVSYNSDDDGWDVKCWANEPADQKNFYMFQVYINDNLYDPSLDQLVLSDDKLVNGNTSQGASFYFIAGESMLNVGDKVTLEFNIISEDYYNFLQEAQTSSELQIPLFSGPPANVRSNFTNGALGYFAAYASIRASYTMKSSDFDFYDLN